MMPDKAVSKLINFNERQSLVSVVKSFFMGREKQVKYRGMLSQSRRNLIGVTQGTIMGPLLWNVFVDNLKPCVPHIKYADDKTLYCSINQQDVI